jgi:hypothetical protein
MMSSNVSNVPVTVSETSWPRPFELLVICGVLGITAFQFFRSDRGLREFVRRRR